MYEVVAENMEENKRPNELFGVMPSWNVQQQITKGKNNKKQKEEKW